MILFFLLFFVLFPLHTLGATWDVGGHYKNLSFTSERAATSDPYTANVHRLRLEGRVSFLEKFSAELDWDNELVFGDYVQAEEFDVRQNRRDIPYPDMHYEIAREQNFFYGQQIYRGFVRADTQSFVATVGRQRVDWGVMRINPAADLFVSPPVFEVEKDELIGQTAANVMIPVGNQLRFNAVYTLHEDFDQSRTGLRATRTLGVFDTSVFGGRFLKDVIVGMDVDGNVKSFGLRGEFFYDWAGVGDDFFQLAVGTDYAFPNTLYFALEYFFNNQRTNALATAPFLKTINDHFVGTEVSYDITPLWKITLLSQTDVRGRSFAVNPESRYSLTTSIDLKAGSLFFFGKSGGEFTAFPHFYYVQGQIFF